MRVLHQSLSVPETCHYLPDRDATQEYVQVGQLAPQEYEDLMNRGYRKFGAIFFRPKVRHSYSCRTIM